MVRLESKVQPVRLALQGHRAFKDRLVRKAIMVLLAHKVLQVRKAIMVLLAHKVLQVRKAIMVLLAHKVLQVRPGPTVHLESKVQPVRLALQGRRVQRVQLVQSQTPELPMQHFNEHRSQMSPDHLYLLAAQCQLDLDHGICNLLQLAQFRPVQTQLRLLCV
jgi:hypothetical protein